MENKSTEKRIIGKYFMEEFVVQAWEEEVAGTKKLEILFFGLCEAKKKQPVLNIYEQEGEIEITLDYGGSCAYWFMSFSEKKYEYEFIDGYNHGLELNISQGIEVKWTSDLYKGEVFINVNFD